MFILLLMANAFAINTDVEHVAIKNVTPKHLPNYKEATITIEGDFLLRRSKITLNNLPCTNVTHDGLKKLTCTAPAILEKEVEVKITNILGSITYAEKLKTYDELKIKTTYDQLVIGVKDKYKIFGGVPPYSFEHNSSVFNILENNYFYGKEFGSHDLVVKDSLGNTALKNISLVNRLTANFDCKKRIKDGFFDNMFWLRPGSTCRLLMNGGTGAIRKIVYFDRRKPHWIEIKNNSFIVPNIPKFVEGWRILDEEQITNYNNDSIYIRQDLTPLENKTFFYPILYQTEVYKNRFQKITTNQTYPPSSIFVLTTSDGNVVIDENVEEKIRIQTINEKDDQFVTSTLDGFNNPIQKFSGHIQLGLKIEDGYQFVFADDKTYTFKINESLTNANHLNKVFNYSCFVDEKPKNFIAPHIPFLCGWYENWKAALVVNTFDDKIKFKKVFDEKIFRKKAKEVCDKKVENIKSFFFLKDYQNVNFADLKYKIGFENYSFNIDVATGGVNLDCGTN